MDRHLPKKEQKIFQKSDTLFDVLIHTINDGVLITDINQTIVMTNDVFCSFFGHQMEKISGTSMLAWMESFGSETVETPFVTLTSAPRLWRTPLMKRQLS